jgi:REP element-mobilizing transposase RayT
MACVERRKRLRLAGFDYASTGGYFVTVCTRGKECLFGQIEEYRMLLSPLGQVVEYALDGISDFHPGVELDASIVMPNHVHVIVFLDGRLRPPPLPAVIGAFKARASRRAGYALWQRGYHDRIVRNESELAALGKYVEANPLRWAIDRENPERQLPDTATRAG